MDQVPVIETERLRLTLPEEDAASRVARYFLANREHHAPWSPVPPPGFFTEEFWRDRLRHNREEFAADRSLRLFLFARDATDGPVLGTCNLSEFVRGAFQACYLGFALDAGAVGQGLMHEAARATVDFAFGQLHLHRVMANYIPTNERSGRLLRRLGFVVEGYARDYLRIAGEWRDHVLTSLTNPAAVTRGAPALSER